jgi:hypothetical protein
MTSDNGAGEAVPVRDPSRTVARDYYRQESRITIGNYEPHQKYHIDSADFPEGCSCVWVPGSLLGMPLGVLEKYLANGWVLARACDFPAISGFGKQWPKALIDAGRAKPVEADALVERDTQILLVRPTALSERAEEDRLAGAREQVSLQEQRLYSSSIRAGLKAGNGPGTTEFRHGRQYANPDTFPEHRGSRGEV